MGYKIYICGPMSNYPNFNFPAFDATRDMLKAQHPDWVVISPSDMDRLFDGFNGIGNIPNGLTHKTAMHRDLPVVIDCDAIFLLHGWSRSKGAKAEVATAIACGLEIMYAEQAENILDVTLL